MAIPTTRTKVKAEIIIHEEKCNGCGLCVSVCKDFSLQIIDKKVALNDTPVFGCIGCGHCMAICPNDAIEIYGREISPADLFELPIKENSANYEQVFSLYQRRRSIREFKDKPVEKELIDKIVEAAKTAPMGLPPSDVNLLILGNREKVNEFSKDFCEHLDGMKWFVSDWFLSLMRPFWGKPADEMFKGFVKPMFKIFTGGMKMGNNHVLYDAPLAIYFYGSPYTDPADPIITATYAMLVAESLGLGTCMIGSIHPLIQNGKKAKLFREKHGIKYKSREGLFVIFGYPAVKYKKGIRRTVASITILN